MRRLESLQRRHQRAGTEVHRRRKSQSATYLAALLSDSRLQLLQLVEQASRRRQVALPFRSQLQTACGTYQQTHAERLLEPRDLLADHGIGNTQAPGTASEAAGLDHRTENLHRLQPIHPAPCHRFQGIILRKR